MANKAREPRIFEIGLSPELVDVARTYRELPLPVQQQVLDLIRENEERLVSIRNEIAGLELPKGWFERRELQQAADTIEPKLGMYRSFVSALRRVPPEVMGEIFEYYLSCVSSQGNEDDSDIGSFDGDWHEFHPERYSRGGPTLLCLVCQDWNRIVTATPALWSKLTIKGIQLKVGVVPCVKPCQVDGISRWLSLLGSYPWSLSLNIIVDETKEIEFEKSEDPSAGRLSRLLQPVAPHLKRLIIDARTSSLGLGGISFPNLTSMVLSASHWQEFSATNLPSLPGITRLVFRSDPHTQYLPSHIPWSQLTHLFLGFGVYMDQWRSIIKQCVNLQRGTFELCLCRREDLTYPEPEQLVTLPHLKQLTFLDRWPFESAIPGLYLPALTKLQDFTFTGVATWHASLSLVFTNVTHLNLTTRMSANNLIRILQGMPHITELFFTISTNYEDMFHFLTFGKGKHNVRFLRVLGMYMETHLSVPEDSEEGLEFPYRALADFLASRTRTFTQNEGELSPPYGAGVNQLAQLEHLVLRVDNIDYAEGMVGKIRDVVDAYSSYGLKSRVFGTKMYTPTQLSPPQKHWDEGFMDFFDTVDDITCLYPRD